MRVETCPRNENRELFEVKEGELLLDHVFITVSDVDRSIAFYERALRPLGIGHAVDYDGKDGPPGHPDLKGFGRDGRVFFWLRQGDADAKSAHIGFVARSKAEVDAFYEAADELSLTTLTCKPEGELT